MSRARLAVLSAATLLLVSGYWWLPLVLRPLSFFAVRHVEVRGARYLAPGAVVTGMGLRRDASIFDDLGAIEARLSSMGGIASARVTRVLPATLVADVTEVEPVALARGPDGLVPVSREGRPLPYDAAQSPVDAPIVATADRELLEALRLVQSTDPGLFADVAAARAAEGEMILDMTKGRVRLGVPVSPASVRSVSAVRRYLDSLQVAWRELDGRYQRWVVVRRAGPLPTPARETGARARHAAPTAPRRPSARPRARAATAQRSRLASVPQALA